MECIRQYNSQGQNVRKSKVKTAPSRSGERAPVMYLTPNKTLMPDPESNKDPKRKPSFWRQLLRKYQNQHERKLRERNVRKAHEAGRDVPDLENLPWAELNLHHIFYTHYEDYEKTKPVYTNVNFVAVQRMAIHCLQRRLTEVVGDMLATGMNEDSISRGGRLVHELCKAVRDREYMKTFAERGYMENPFVLTSEKAYDAALLKDNRLILPYYGEKQYSLLLPVDAANPDLPGPPWDYENQAEAAQDRFAAAVLGGAALIGPMFIMVLVRTKPILTRLLTVSLFTVGFALALALGSERKPLEVMTATAAYAAILVVFVGTNSG